MKLLKKISALAAAFALMLSVSVNVYAKETPVKLVVLGDSIATGYGLEGYAAENSYGAAGSWACITAAQLGAEAKKDFYNFAVDGATSSDLIDRLDDKTVAGKVKKAEKIAVSIGGNDVLLPMINIMIEGLASQTDYIENTLGVKTDFSSTGKAFETLSAALAADTDGVVMNGIFSYVASEESAAVLKKAAEPYAEKLVKAMDKIHKLNPKAEIYIFTLYNPFNGVPGLEAVAELGTQITGIINEGIYAAAEAAQAKDYAINTVDTATTINVSPLLMTNISSLDIHPNAAGHKYMAKALLTAMGVLPTEEENEEADVSEETAAAEAVKLDEPSSDKAAENPKTGNRRAAVSGIIAAAALLTAVAAMKRGKKH